MALADDHREDALEWAVEMRRLREQRTMAALLDASRLAPHDVRAVGRRLAAFQAEAEVPSGLGRPSAVKRAIDENFQPLLDLELPARERRRLAAAERFFDAALIGWRDLLAVRSSSGRVRDGHGDLRLEHVILDDDAVTVFDCVEFDTALRQIDVAADLAFLVMELVAHGADNLGDELVAAYREAGGDVGDDALVSFYAGYRAWVRAKLAFLEGGDPSALVAVAERFRWRARLPLVLTVWGVTASGKSTVVDVLARAAGLPLLSSDRVRKDLAGVEPTARASAEHYEPAANRRTYRELGARARRHVGRCGGAIIDATFRRRAERRAFSEGFAAAPSRVLYLECRAPRPVLLTRARLRARVTDATTELVDRQLAEWEPLDEVAPAAHVCVRSDQAPPAIVDELEAALDRRLANGWPDDP